MTQATSPKGGPNKTGPDKTGSAKAGRKSKSRRPKLEGAQLRIGKQRVPLFSGAMHYWRVPRHSWRAGLKEIRELGLPIVETYIPWSVHETSPGVFDFGQRSPRKDVAAFLDLAADVGLFVFARPGPHINAEMTYFGIPERIVYDPDCQARSPRQNPVVLGFPPRMFPVPSHASATYQQEVRQWYDAVAPIVTPRVWPKGPIVLMQVDNEACHFFRNGPYDQDYHPDAVRQYQRFLRTRHRDLERLSEIYPDRYGSWADVQPPPRFEARRASDLPPHLDWAQFQEHMTTRAVRDLRKEMEGSGMTGTPLLHNVPLGDAGLPVSVPALDRAVDLVGFDYYHPAREHRTIKRRTLYLAGTVETVYAPELGIGAPPWFTPLSHADSLYCAMAALAFGMRGFNLYMAVDRDRWYGAPINNSGRPRAHAIAWKRLIAALRDTRFETLHRRAEVALVFPRPYARLARATHLLGPVSPSSLEAFGRSPVDACREDSFEFDGPVQVRWWDMLATFADALTRASIPYVYVDSEARASRFEGYRVVVAPTYEFVSAKLWDRLQKLSQSGTHVVHGPCVPHLDESMQVTEFDSLDRAHHVHDVHSPEAVDALVSTWVSELNLLSPFRARPSVVETAIHSDKRGPAVLFAMNPGQKYVEASIELPEPMHLYDPMSDHVFTGEREAVIPLAPRTVRMLRCEARGKRPRKRPSSRRRQREGAARNEPADAEENTSS